MRTDEFNCALESRQKDSQRRFPHREWLISEHWQRRGGLWLQELEDGGRNRGRLAFRTVDVHAGGHRYQPTFQFT